MARRRASPALFVKFDTSDSNIVAGDIVAIDSSNSNSVIRADASDPSKMPVIGIAKSVRADSVVVQRNYIYTLPANYVINISTGDILWADPSLPGKLTSTVPPSGTLQRVARGKKEDKTILLTVETVLIDL